MSFDHSLYIDLYTHKDVQVDQIISAIRPLLDYFEIPESVIAQIPVEQLPDTNEDENEFSIVIDSTGSNSHNLFIHTSGDVKESFYDIVDTIIENLAPLCVPEKIELHNHDTGDLSSAIVTYWVGAGDELIVAKRLDAFADLKLVLNDTGVSSDQIEAIKEMVLNLPIEPSDRPLSRPKV